MSTQSDGSSLQTKIRGVRMETYLADTLTLDLPASSTVRNFFIKPPSL